MSKPAASRHPGWLLRAIPVVAALLPWLPSVLWAHFHMLLPESPTAQAGDTVRTTYMKGHPFEHELIAVEPPKEVKVHPPAGKAQEL